LASKYTAIPQFIDNISINTKTTKTQTNGTTKENLKSKVCGFSEHNILDF